MYIIYRQHPGTEPEGSRIPVVDFYCSGRMVLWEIAKRDDSDRKIRYIPHKGRYVKKNHKKPHKVETKTI